MTAGQILSRKTGVDGNLCERTLALLQHYGQGSRARFLDQIARRAGKHGEAAPTQKDWWRIFNRLQDFGLVAIGGSLTSPSWVWLGDCVFQRATGQYLCPTSAVACEWFEPISSRPWEKQTACEISVARGNSFKLEFLQFSSSTELLHAIPEDLPSPPVKRIESLIRILPSAEELLMRSATLSEKPMVELGLEVRGLEEAKWEQANEKSLLKQGLLKKLRTDGIGYQYWVIGQQDICYQLTASDWLPLLHWYVCSANWQCIYDKAHQTLAIPAHVFYSLPSMIRYALVSKSMQWPQIEVIESKRFLVFTELARNEVKYFLSLYQPALRINNV